MLFAQQAIFDRGGNVMGYELLYRAAGDRRRAGSADTEMMGSTVLVNAFLDAQLPLLLEGRPAFVNVGRQFLVDGVVDLLDPGAVVVELLETVSPDPEIVGACQRLTERGYRLALDDFVAGDPREALLPFVDIVKVDVLAQPRRQLEDVTKALTGRARLLAEKVEDAGTHDACEQLGFEMFQGYFYRRPQITEGRALAPDLLRTLSLMELLRDPTLPQAELVKEFQSDPGLTLKLVRMANVAAVGVREVASIPHAIGLLGRGPLHRWLALIFAAAAVGPSPLKRELLRETVARARFCELLAQASGGPDPGEAFLVGLFSGIEALLESPLSSLLAQLRLAPQVLRAVTRAQGPLAWLLTVAAACETGSWEAALDLARDHGVERPELAAARQDAHAWTRQTLSALG